MIKQPWNNWFHICCNTYGTWVRGDPRGWRERHHREHVDGDYKHPPPKGKYDGAFKGSNDSMKRKKVELTPVQRAAILPVFAETLFKNEVELVELAIGKKHTHALAGFNPAGTKRDWNKPRVMIGRAKGASARALSKAGLIAEGGVWGKRCKVRPIENRRHQLVVADYIERHGRKGSVVLSIEAKKCPDLKKFLTRGKRTQG